MSSIRTLIFRTLITVVLGYCMGAGVYYSWDIINNYSVGKSDYVSEWESRFAGLKKALPAGEEKVGYISDWDTRGYDKNVYIEFVLTQYTLAPLVVERNLNHEWIIANSTSPEFLDWVANQMTQPYTIQSFGNGIYLIHTGDE
jgi:hypothetical protein